jgi:hypothetical protein
VDTSLFIYIHGNIQIYMLVYVDNILIIGTHPRVIYSIIAQLQSKFPLKDLGTLSYFLGIHVTRDASGLHACQTKYISELLLQVNAFCDSDWAGCPDDRRSTTGFAVFLGDCLIAWSAKNQAVVSRSSTEAEYRSLSITTAELFWIRMLFKELRIYLATPPVL